MVLSEQCVAWLIQMDNDYELQFWPSTVINGIIMPITTGFLYIIINPFITIGGHLFRAFVLV